MELDKSLSTVRRIISNIDAWDKIESPPEALFKSLVELLCSYGIEFGIIETKKSDSIYYIPICAWAHEKLFSPSQFAKNGNFLFIKDLHQYDVKKVGDFPTINNSSVLLQKDFPDTKLKVIPIFLRQKISALLIFIPKNLEILHSLPQDTISIIQDVISLKLREFDLQKRIFDICDFTPDPTLIMDSNGIIKLWNKAIVDMSGWEAEKVIGKGDFINAIPFYGKPRITLPHMALNPDHEGERLYIEFRNEKDGIYSVAFCPSLPGGGAYVSSKTTKLLDLNSRLFGAIQTIRDVTRQREMERDLQRNLKIQKAVNRVSGLGMVTFSGNDVVYCNQYMGQILKRPSETVRIAHIRQLLRYVPSEKKEVTARFFNLLQGKIDSSHTLLLHLKQKSSEQFYQCYMQPDESAGEPLTHLIVEDITEKRKLEEKIRLSELRLYHEDRLTALGTMAAGIAHELNQPLNAIKTECSTFLWEFEKGVRISTNEFKYNIDTIYQQVERMSEVIRNVRAFSRDDKETVIGHVDLNEAVNNVFSIIGTQLELHGIKVHKTFEERNLYVKAGMSQLEQIIMNLLVNSRQALEEITGNVKTIIVKTKALDESALLYIEDNGAGIPRNLRGKIFDPFLTTKDPGKGTGLGLTISRSIAKDLGGDLELIKSSPKGTAFGLHLPLDEYNHENSYRG